MVRFNTLSRRRSLLVLLAAAAFCAGPARGADVEGIDILLIIDESGSMKQNDKEYWRKKASMVIGAYAHPRDRVAVVVYSSSAGVLRKGFTPIGADRKPLFAAVKAATTGGGTNFNAAFRVGRKVLERRKPEFRDRAVLVLFLTDGEAQKDEDLPSNADLEEFRKQGWAVNGMARGAGADLTNLSKWCQMTGGVSRSSTNEASEIMNFFLELYQAKTGQVRVKGRKASEDNLTRHFSRAQVAPGDEWLDLNFSALLDEGQPGRIEQVLRKGQVVWTANRGATVNDVEIERSPVEWSFRKSVGRFEVIRIRRPKHADWAIKLSGNAQVDVAYSSRIHGKAIPATPHPVRPVPAMIIFRDDEGNTIRDEAFYGFVKSVKARLRLVLEGKVLDTIELKRQADGAPPEIAPAERPYAYWDYFKERPGTDVPYIIAYEIEYVDESVARPTGVVTQIPSLGLTAEPSRLVVDAETDEVVLKTKLALVGSLRRGRHQIVFTATDQASTSFIQEVPRRKTIVPGDRVRIQVDPAQLTITDVGEFAAEVTLTIPLPSRDIFGNGKCIGEILLQARSRRITIAPTKVTVELARNMYIDLRPVTVSGAPDAGAGKAYWGTFITFTAKARAGQPEGRLSLPGQLTAPGGTKTKMDMRRIDDVFEARIPTPIKGHDLGSYRFDLLSPGDGSYLVGKGTRTLEILPYAATPGASSADVTVGQGVELIVQLSPAGEQIKELKGTWTGPDGTATPVTLTGDGGRLTAQIEKLTIPGRHQFRLDSHPGITAPDDPVTVVAGLPSARFSIEPAAPAWGTSLTLKIAGWESEPAIKEAAATVTGPDGKQTTITLTRAGDAFTAPWAPPAAGAYAFAVADETRKTLIVTPATVEVRVRALAATFTASLDGEHFGASAALTVTVDAAPARITQRIGAIAVTVTGPDDRIQIVSLAPDDANAGVYRAAYAPTMGGTFQFAVPPVPGGLIEIDPTEIALTVRPHAVTLSATPDLRTLVWSDAVQVEVVLNPGAEKEILPEISLQKSRQGGATSTVALAWKARGRYLPAEPVKLGPPGSVTELKVPAHPQGAHDASGNLLFTRGTVKISSSVPAPYTQQPVDLTAQIGPDLTSSDVADVELVIAQAGKERRVAAAADAPGRYVARQIRFGPGEVTVRAAPAGKPPIDTGMLKLMVDEPVIDITVLPKPPAEPVEIGTDKPFTFTATVSATNLHTEIALKLRLQIPAEHAAAATMLADGQALNDPFEVVVKLTPDGNHQAEAKIRFTVQADDGALPWWFGQKTTVSLIRTDGRDIPGATYDVRGVIPLWFWLAAGGAVLFVLVLMLVLYLRALARRPRWANEHLVPGAGDRDVIRLGARSNLLRPVADMGAEVRLGGTRTDPTYQLEASAGRGAELPALTVNGQPVGQEPAVLRAGDRIGLQGGREDVYMFIPDPTALGGWKDEMLLPLTPQGKPLHMKEVGSAWELAVPGLNANLRRWGVGEGGAVYEIVPGPEQSLVVGEKTVSGPTALQAGQEFGAKDGARYRLINPDAAPQWEMEVLVNEDDKDQSGAEAVFPLRRVVTGWEANAEMASVVIRKAGTTEAPLYFIRAAEGKQASVNDQAIGAEYVPLKDEDLITGGGGKFRFQPDLMGADSSVLVLE